MAGCRPLGGIRHDSAARHTRRRAPA